MLLVQLLRWQMMVLKRNITLKNILLVIMSLD